MPYIESPIIKAFLFDELDKVPVTNVGELNFAITTLCNRYLNIYCYPINYASLNAIIGVLEAAKLEFYRRAMTTYEDHKMKQNGDVYSKLIQNINRQESLQLYFKELDSNAASQEKPST